MQGFNYLPFNKLELFKYYYIYLKINILNDSLLFYENKYFTSQKTFAIFVTNLKHFF